MVAPVCDMPTFRVFVSSTFADFALERDALQRTVFPRLDLFCRARGARFEAVDLRWGVSREAAESHGALEICLREIERCQRLSPSPNFLVMLGDRYGWRPVPARIPATEFEAIAAALRDPAERAQALEAYRRDGNVVPPEYQLCAPAMDSSGEGRLRAMLERGALAAALPADRMLVYRASATHQEIVRGLLSQPGSGNHVVAVMREIRGLRAEDPQAAAYVDLLEGRTPDASAAVAVASLKQELRARLPGRVCDVEAQWKDGALTGRHVPAFCEHVEERLQAQVEAQLAGLRAAGAGREEERVQHAAFGRARRAVFVAREGDIADALGRLSGSAPPAGWLSKAMDALRGRTAQANPVAPLLVLAEGGAGKSAFVAALVSRVQALSPRTVAIERYVGASPASASLPDLVHGICREMAMHYGAPGELPAPAEWPELARAFQERLAAVPSRRPLLLAIDALDQLDGAGHGLGWSWLPLQLPAHVRIVVSSRAGGGIAPLEAALPRRAVLQLAPLDAGSVAAMLDAWLAASGRTLQPAQRDLLVPSLASCPLPLYVKLVHEVVKHWPQWQEPEGMPGSVAGLVDRLVAHLASPERHGKALVHSALSHLALARLGLSDAEMQAVLAADPAVVEDFRARSVQRWDGERLPPILWTRLYFDLEGYLRETAVHGSALYSFFHREFGERIAARAAGPDAAARHARIAGVLDAACENPFEAAASADPAAWRVLMEKPFQLAAADAEAAARLLGGLDFAMAKVRAGLLDDLVRDHALVLAANAPAAALDGVRAMRDCIAAHAHLLRRASEAWPAERTLLQVASEQPPGTALRAAAERWMAARPGDSAGAWEWLRCANPASDASPGMLRIEAGFKVDGMHWLADGRLLLREMRRLKVVDPRSGIVLMDMAIADYLHGVRQLAGGALLLEESAGVRAWNPDTGHFLAELAQEDVRSCCEMRDGRALLGLFRGFGVWDRHTRRFALCGNTAEPVMGIAELPGGGGRLVLTWGWSVQLWRVAGTEEAPAAELLATLEQPRSFIKDGRKEDWYVQRDDLFVTEDARVVFRATDGSVHCFSISGASPAKLWEHRDPAISAIQVLDRGVLCFRDYEYAHVLLDAGGAEVRRLPKAFYSPGSTLVQADGARIVVASPDHPLCAWSHEGELLWQFGIEGERNYGAFVLAGGEIAVSTSQGVFVLDPHTGATLFRHTVHSGAGGAFLPTPDGRGAAMAVEDSVYLWPDVCTPGRVEQNSGRLPRPPRCTPLEGGRALVHGKDASILDTRTGETLHARIGATHAGRTPHGALIAFDGGIELRDTGNGVLVASAAGHREAVVGSCTCTDGVLVTLSADAAVMRHPASLLELSRCEEGEASFLGLLPLASGGVLLWRADGAVLAWRQDRAAVEMGRHAGEIGGALALPGQPGIAVSYGEDGLRSWDATGACAIAHCNVFDSVGSEWGTVSGVAGAIVLPDGRVVAWGKCESEFRVFRAPVFEQCFRLPGNDRPVGAAVLADHGELVLWSHEQLWRRRLDETLSPIVAMQEDEVAGRHPGLYAMMRWAQVGGDPLGGHWTSSTPAFEYESSPHLERHAQGGFAPPAFWHTSEPVTTVALLPEAALVADAFGRISCLHLYRGGTRVDFLR